MEGRSCTRASIQRVKRTGILLLFLAAAAPGQAQTVLSETTWGGTNSESTEGVAVAGDGSSYLTGFTLSFSEFQTPLVFLVKFSPTGSLVWQRTWDGPSQFFRDDGKDIALASDGSVYVAGNTLGVGGDALLLKFSPDGSLLWQRTWGSPDGDFGQAVEVGPDGSVYLVGSTRLFDPGAADLFVVKFGPDGTMLWQKTWGTLDAFEEGQGVAVGPDGSVYVASYTPRVGTFDFDIALLKLNSAGSLEWARTYASGSVDSRGGLTVAPDGSVYVAGGYFDPRTSDLQSLLVRFSSDGSLVWDRTWGADRTGDDPGDVAIDPNGNILLVGQTGQGGAGGDDAYLVRFSPGGKVMDAVTWGSPGLDGARGVDVAPGGTISLGAVVENPPPYSLLAASKKAARARGTSSSSAIPLVDATGTVADPGGVLATPNGSTTFAGGFDAALVRLSPSAQGLVLASPTDELGVGRTLQRRGVRVALSPASTSTRMTFAMGAELSGQPFSAQVFDVSGRRVRTITGFVRDAAAEVTWDLRAHDGKRVPNGIYFIAVQAGPSRQMGRMTVVR